MAEYGNSSRQSLIPWLHSDVTPLEEAACHKFCEHKLYLDTNILQDIIMGRNWERTNQLILEIKKPEYQCCTSTFALMEMADIIQTTKFAKNEFENKKEYNVICRGLHERKLTANDYKNIYDQVAEGAMRLQYMECVVPSGKTWDLAMGIAVKSALYAPDTLHLATALESKCGYLVTNDRFMRDESQMLMDSNHIQGMRICDADETVKGLRGLQ